MGNPRIILLAALAFVVMMMWQEWQKDYRQKALQGQAITSAADQGGIPGAPDQTQASTASGVESQELPELPKNLGVESAPPPGQPQDVKSVEQKTILSVVTDVLKVSIDLRGGEIQDLRLRDYPVSLEKPDEPFVMMHKQADSSYVAQSGLLSRQSAPNHLALYQAEQREYRLSEGDEQLVIPLTWRDDKGIEVTKTLTFYRGRHYVDVKHTIANNSDGNWQGSQYRQIVRTDPDKSQGLLITFTGAAYYSEEDKFEKLKFGDIQDENLSKSVTGGWVGMIEHYFLSSWIPDQTETNNFYTKFLKTGARHVIGMVSAEKQIAAGSSGSFESRLYAGPKKQHVLEELAPGLKLSVDYGWLTIIAQPIFALMEFIYKSIVSNWGWAIILLTLTIKAVFFKLSEYGYRSMANMRRVQPKMTAIKDKYGSDKQRMQQAMMELYRKEKINPMSGCFPILVQIPVFIALYWVLLESVELRQAPFMFWIKDLSVQDPYFVLPIIMGITMFIQQKLNPAPMDEMQKMVMKVLPLLFTVFFLFFPAGLVLYWVVNNVLSIAQQWVINRRIESGTGKH